MRPAVLGVAAASVALGVTSEAVGYGWKQPLLWLPDLVVGLVWCAAGLRLWTARPTAAALALGVGMTWFFSNVFPITVFWHRGMLIHLLLFLAVASRSRVVVVTVALGYMFSLTPIVWREEGATIALAGALLVVAGRGPGHGRTPLARAAQSSLVVTSLVLIVSAVTRMAWPERGGGALPTLLVYEVTLVVVAIVLVAAGGAPDSDSVADRVLELNDGPASSLRDALAEVLDDPDLEVGYWRDHERGYTDIEGNAVVPPPAGHGRVGLPIDDHGSPLALVVHDAALQGDPRLAAAVRVATRLAAANAQLRARVGDRHAELAASRSRLVRTADQERADLASLLRVGPRARLTTLRETLRNIPDPQGDLAVATERVAETLEDLGRWERGLRPRDLDGGLGPALVGLAETSSIPVAVSVSGTRLPVGLETALYYVCAEALNNVSKHAAAEHATVRITRHADHVSLVISDDGTGGADPGAGSGLLGARDRLEALGGTLSVTSTPGDGTRLSGTVPLSLVSSAGDSSTDPAGGRVSRSS